MPGSRPVRSEKANAAVKSRGRVDKPARRLRPPEAVVAASPQRSDNAMLAAEVRRLEQELAAARQQLAALEARADVDPLTGLLNRRAFERELARAVAYAKRYGTSVVLLYLDLDDFKRINDQHGHAAGDVMLRAVASVLGRHVRESDIVARMGGDEFALLLWNCDEAQAFAKALALEAAIGRTVAGHDGVALTVGASAGVATLLPLDRPSSALERADRAMYQRKATRRASPAAS